MRRYFKKDKIFNNIYYYNYSVENKMFDGEITYDLDTETIKIIKPCKNDIDNTISQKRTILHFYKVIDDNFPDYRAVITG